MGTKRRRRAVEGNPDREKGLWRIAAAIAWAAAKVLGWWIDRHGH